VARGVNCPLPVVVLALLTGYILGIVCLRISAEMGFTSTLKAILPHGVLEIPALIIRRPTGCGSAWCSLGGSVGVTGKGSESRSGMRSRCTSRSRFRSSSSQRPSRRSWFFRWGEEPLG